MLCYIRKHKTECITFLFILSTDYFTVRYYYLDSVLTQLYYLKKLSTNKI